MSAGADALAGAKAVALHAENFDKSVAKQSGHEYSKAPYSMVAKAKKESSVEKPEGSSIIKEAGDAGAGIKARMENQKKYNDAMKSE